MTPETNVRRGSDQLLNFIKFLRGRGIPVSPADTLEAVKAAGLLGFDDRSALRSGLGAVLAKSKHENVLFEQCFEDFFSFSSTDEPPKTPHPQDDDQQADDQTSEPQDKNPMAAAAQTLTEAASTSPALAQALQTELMQNMLSGNEAAMAIAIENAANAIQVDTIRMFTQRGQYTRKMLDQLGERQLRDAVIELEGQDSNALEALQMVREALTERARNRVERAYLLNASGATEELLDNTLTEVKLGNVAPHQMARMKKLIERMARKLASRHGRRRRKTKRGQLNVPATLRRSLATDAVPFEPRWRRIQKKRPQVLAVCDVSGSVATYAKFLLMFLYAVQDVLPRTRTFAFSSNLGEVTDYFADLPVDEAINLVNHKYGGATDYARALNEFSDLALADINTATTVIFLGDARNNNADPRLDILAEIKARCRRLIWLNPETRRAWGTGDSEMLPVIRHCHFAQECNTLKQLERIVDKLLADSR